MHYMEPLTLTLIGYPLSILAAVTIDQAKKLKENFGDLAPLEKLYLKSFYKALDHHKKYYDETASDITKMLKRAIRKDERRLLHAISDEGNIIFTSFSKKEFLDGIAYKIIDTYSFKSNVECELITKVVFDCFKYYLSSFLQLMSEKEGIQAILLECLKLDHILEILNKINQQLISKEEFDELRKIALKSHIKNDAVFAKGLKDYDSYIKKKFKYLELRGFSPKISGKEVQMELGDIFVPLAINQQKKSFLIF